MRHFNGKKPVFAPESVMLVNLATNYRDELTGTRDCTDISKIYILYVETKELSFWNKFKFSNPYIFTTLDSNLDYLI